MKQILLSMTVLFAMSVNAQIMDCSQLFISEYVEGSGNNKALEIYNPTSQDIDLGLYMIIRYSNGATGASSVNAIQLVGMIAPNDVHVGVIDKINPSGSGQEVPVATILQASADAFYCPDYNTSNAWYFNGNDAIVLARGSVNDIANSVTVDIFGKVGEDPASGAWTADAASGFTQGAWWTMNHTLIRKNTVLTGDINPVDLFNPSLEWDSIPQDSWLNLGSHNCNCFGSSYVQETDKSSYSLYPNPANMGDIVSVNTAEAIQKIVITNILGEQLNFDKFINTSVLAKGIYIVDIEFVNGTNSNTKLIIK